MGWIKGMENTRKRREEGRQDDSLNVSAECQDRKPKEFNRGKGTKRKVDTSITERSKVVGKQ
jgi:hypothetical protein